jgi:hypothetical protein
VELVGQSQETLRTVKEMALVVDAAPKQFVAAASGSDIAEEGFGVGCSDAVSATRQPRGRQFSIGDPALDSPLMYVEERGDFGDGQ